MTNILFLQFPWRYHKFSQINPDGRRWEQLYSLSEYILPVAWGNQPVVWRKWQAWHLHWWCCQEHRHRWRQTCLLLESPWRLRLRLEYKLLGKLYCKCNKKKKKKICTRLLDLTHKKMLLMNWKGVLSFYKSKVEHTAKHAYQQVWYINSSHRMVNTQSVG